MLLETAKKEPSLRNAMERRLARAYVEADRFNDGASEFEKTISRLKIEESNSLALVAALYDYGKTLNMCGRCQVARKIYAEAYAIAKKE